MKSEITRLPSWKNGIWQIWRRNFLDFKRSWMVNLLWILVEPLFILLALGYGLGFYIPSIAGVSYVDFFFPALLCSSAMMVSFFTATYDAYAKMNHQRVYETMLLTPLTSDQIVIGEITWAATRGTFSALGVALFAGLFGHIETILFVPAIVIIFISSFLFAALGMIITSWVRNYDGIIYPLSGLMVPMSLFSGTYFPLEQFPYGLKYLAYLFPLTHSVAAVRGLLLENRPSWQILIHTAVLIIVAVVLAQIAKKRIQKKLEN